MTQRLNIPFFALDRQFAENKKEFLKKISTVLSTGQVLQGPSVSQLENKIAHYCNRKYAIAVGSCTDALAFALVSAGVKPGDEVLVTSFSFIASVSPILRVGAVPVFIDIESDYYMMDLNDAKKKITPKTKFLIAVHLFGQCLNMDEVEKFASECNLTIIEDAAQSLGSFFNKRSAGNLGLISCISFDPTKVLGSFGSGGMVLTDSKEIADDIKKLRYHGKDTATGDFLRLGYNSQLSSEHSALLSYKLDLLPKWIEKRNLIAKRYIDELGNTEGIFCPRIRYNSAHNWHKFVIRYKNRDVLRKYLLDCGIQTMIHYPKPLSDIPYISEYVGKSYEVQTARTISSEVLSLPIYPELTKDEIDYTIKIVKKFFADNFGGLKYE